MTVLSDVTNIRWRTSRGLRDVFGNPIEWRSAPHRPVYRDGGGRRVRLRQRVQAGLSDDMRDAVERASKATGRPMAEVVRRALIGALAR